MRKLLLYAAILAGLSSPVMAQTWSAANNSGVAFESNSSNGNVFGAYFGYRLDGSPTFRVFDRNDQSSTHVNGVTYTARGGAVVGGVCQPVTLTAGGSVRMTFANARQGTLQLDSGAVQDLTRTEIQSGYPEPTANAGFPARGWYWDANCPGQGLHVEVMGSTIFGLLFAYEGNGDDTWYFVNGTLTTNSNGSSTFSGALNRCSRATGSTVCPSVGNVTLLFVASRVEATWPNGSTSTLTPFSF